MDFHGRTVSLPEGLVPFYRVTLPETNSKSTGKLDVWKTIYFPFGKA